jgi:hypothetical protein
MVPEKTAKRIEDIVSDIPYQTTVNTFPCFTRIRVDGAHPALKIGTIKPKIETIVGIGTFTVFDIPHDANYYIKWNSPMIVLLSAILACFLVVTYRITFCEF